MNNPFFHSLLVLFVLAGAASGLDFDVEWAQPFPVTEGFDVALGDIDGDGDNDAVHAFGPGLDTRVFLNDGSGTFTLDPSNVLPSATSCALGDVNDDTHLDLVYVGQFAPSGVWTNNGIGIFLDSGQSPGAVNARRYVGLVDLDGDDDLDLLLPTDTTALANELWFNDGTGTFTNSGQSLGSEFTRNIAVGDVDGDLDPDLVLANNGFDRLWLNDGAGNFTQSTQLFANTGTFGVQLGDLDGDLDLDLFFVNGDNSPSRRPNKVWLNNGSGVFTDTGQSLGNDYSFDVRLLDVNGDTYLDALEVTNFGMTNRVWTNNGSAVFSDSGLDLGSDEVLALDLADLDGDMDLDAFLAGGASPSSIWFFPPGGGQFVDGGQRFGSTLGLCSTKGDFNGDGALDVAIGTEIGDVRFFLNNGAGKFHEHTSLITIGFETQVQRLAAGDLDNDGDLDIVLAYSESETFGFVFHRSIYLNNGDASFTLQVAFPPGIDGEEIVIADIDNDGDQDVVVGNSSANGEFPIFLNDGSANFVETADLGTGRIDEFALVDLDCDGDLDAFLGGRIDDPNEVWFNDGTGDFVDSGQALGGSTTRCVVPADFDGDGDIDVACGNGSSQANVIWLNDGNGFFTQSPADIGTGATREIEVVDANSDGIPDLWIGNGNVGTIGAVDWIYQNDGAGGFTLVQTTESRPSFALSAGDFTGDGKVDIFSVGYDLREAEHQLYNNARTCLNVRAYAAGFGLTGGDTGVYADPDLDGVNNMAEFAYNLNPAIPDANVISNFATATNGLPNLEIELVGGVPVVTVQFVRRLNTICYQYDVAAARTLLCPGFSAPLPIVFTDPIDTNYERVSYTATLSAAAAVEFAALKLLYAP